MHSLSEESNRLKVEFHGDESNIKDSKGFTRTQLVPVECLRYEARKVAIEIIYGRRKSKYLPRKWNYSLIACPSILKLCKTSHMDG